ncbi:MAG: choice-of-anchor F family protein [Pseudomonadota bacterium]
MESNWKSVRWPASAVSAMAMMSVLSVAQAGKVTSDLSATGAQGFGGWNLDNVTVIVPGGSFDPDDGSYNLGPEGSYSADVDDGAGTVMAKILAKPWPVGEPPGIKVINDDLAVKVPKPTNCIMSTSYLEGFYLDSGDPQQVICSSGFQSHKRYKQAMLPSMVDGVGSEGADMVFNVEAEAGSRDYQVFQKINNWTDSRLEGFTIQVGFGVGAAFQTASAAGVDPANLSLSVPSEVWAANQLANFAHGLFGPPDKHFPEQGFFDGVRAGYTIAGYPILSGVTDTLTSDVMLAGNYTDVPPGGEQASNQFGPWLPNIWLPQGIFFDTDGNPDTDAELLAWFGYNPATDNFEWMTGQVNGFQPITDQVIEGWAGELAYSMGVIDDLVNVGLNYIVTIGDVSTFPGSTFTIRITPRIDSTNTPQPDYVDQPTPVFAYTSSTGVISLNPSPEFLIGDPLFVRVGDADMNLDPNAADTLDVQASSNGLNATITLTEEGDDRGVFVAGLPAEFSNVEADTVVTVTYDDGINGNISASSTAKRADTIVESFVTIDQLIAPVTVKGGATRAVKVKVSLDAQGLTTESGFLTVKAIDDDPLNNDIVFETGFTLDPKQSVKYTFDWIAPVTAQTILWEASVALDSGAYVAPLTATTEVKASQPNKP